MGVCEWAKRDGEKSLEGTEGANSSHHDLYSPIPRGRNALESFAEKVCDTWSWRIKITGSLGIRVPFPEQWVPCQHLSSLLPLHTHTSGQAFQPLGRSALPATFENRQESLSHTSLSWLFNAIPQQEELHVNKIILWITS